MVMVISVMMVLLNNNGSYDGGGDSGHSPSLERK